MSKADAVRYLMKTMEYSDTTDNVCINCVNNEISQKGTSAELLMCAFNPACKFSVDAWATCKYFDNGKFKLK